MALQVDAKWEPREGYKLEEREKRDHRAHLGRSTNIWRYPKLEFVEKPDPTPREDEVLLKVGATGVCGSDTTFLGRDSQGYTIYPGHCKLPCIIGHEFSGEIVEVGKNVDAFQVGDLVTAETMNWCGECMACRKGMFNQCENLEEVGFTLDGGFAEYMVVRAKYCFDLGDLMPIYGSEEKVLEVGALVEPTAVAYNGMFSRGGGFKPGGHVVVFGAGPIGLASIALAKTCGAAKIISFEICEPRMKLARTMGADHVFNFLELEKEGSSPAERILDITKGSGASLLVEATENQVETIPEAERAMAIDGKIVQIGISFGKTPISAFLYQRKGAHYHGTIGSSGHSNWASVINLMTANRLDMGKVITKRFRLENAVEAIKQAATRKEGKHIVTPHW